MSGLNRDQKGRINIPLTNDKEWGAWFLGWLRENAVVVVLGLLGWVSMLFSL